MESTEPPLRAKSPDNRPTGNMASPDFRELLWGEERDMEQYGFMIIRAYEEGGEEARAIREMVKSYTEETRQDTHSASLTAHWLDKEKQIIFETFMGKGVDVRISYLRKFSIGC